MQTHDVDAKPVVEAADILKRDRVVADAVEEIALHAIAPETSCEREAFLEKSGLGNELGVGDRALVDIAAGLDEAPVDPGNGGRG